MHHQLAKQVCSQMMIISLSSLRMRDGMSPLKAVASSGEHLQKRCRTLYDPGRDFKDLAWDNYLLRMRGRETVISAMDGIWTGYWARWVPCTS